MTQRLVVTYATPEAFLDAMEQEVANGGLLVRGVRPEGDDPACVVEVQVAQEPPVEVPAQIGTVARFGVTVSFEEVPAALTALAERLRGEDFPAPESQPAPSAPPAPEAPRGTAADRLAEMTVAQKIAAALSGDRETRLAVFRDHNKVLHAFVLRNPRLQLDEVLFAAKLTTIAPDALKIISENVEWGQNLSICIALVKNPKTPTPVALRLLPKLPQTEIRAIAKGAGKDQLVFAARKIQAG